MYVCINYFITSMYMNTYDMHINIHVPFYIFLYTYSYLHLYNDAAVMISFSPQPVKAAERPLVSASDLRFLPPEEFSPAAVALCCLCRDLLGGKSHEK